MLGVNGIPKSPYTKSTVDKTDKQWREYEYGAQQDGE